MTKIDKIKRIIIENIKELEHKDRIRVLKEIIDMLEAEMLIFGKSK